MTQRFAVFGHPVGHSLSPRIQRAFGEQCGIAIDYTASDAPAEVFGERVRAFFDAGGRGANVTLPDKRLAFELAECHGEAAAAAGVANVLTRLEDGRVRADNTDGSGLLRDLRQRAGVNLCESRVLILGAGGAVHGIAHPLLEAGVARIVIANRSARKAQALAADLGDRAQAVSWDTLAQAGSFALILNATSAGVHGEALVLPESLAGAQTLACDLSYGRAARAFLRWARAAGAAQALDGLGMLVETSADSFELWHDERPQTEAVYAMLRAEGA